MQMTQDQFNRKYAKTLWHIWETISCLKKDGAWWKPNGDCYIPWFANKMKFYNHYNHSVSSPIQELMPFLKDLHDSALIDFPDGVTWDGNAMHCEDVRFPFRLLCDAKFKTPTWRPLQRCITDPEGKMSLPPADLNERLARIERRLELIEHKLGLCLDDLEAPPQLEELPEELQHLLDGDETEDDNGQLN